MTSPSLIVCASLVQNPTNLGGLCRSCEVFGVERLMIADLAIREDWAFRKVAASAHRWQAIATTPISALSDWLNAQKQLGYTIVALTVTEPAESLMTYRFPQKVVLVLGRELTGVPPEILAVCDRVLTIPQCGKVKSLNVQVAGAIAMYEYCRQQALQL